MFLTSQRLRLRHAFSTREGGVSQGPFASLNLGRSVGDDPAHVAENGRRLARAVGLQAGQLVSVNQVHGDRVWEATAGGEGEDLPPALGDADALVTRTPGLAIGVRTADCAPVLIHAPDVGAIAAVHAGWRGAALAIARKAVEELHVRYRAEPARALAVVGPCIRACCYAVSAEVAAQFEARFGAGLAEERAGQIFLDLAGASQRALREAGLGQENIEVLPHCTQCQPQLFFSHRRDRGVSGRHLSFLVLD